MVDYIALLTRVSIASPLCSPGFDRDIFTGNPSLQKLLETYQPRLTDEEKTFLDNQVNTLCSMLNDHEVTTKKDFSREAWVSTCSCGMVPSISTLVVTICILLLTLPPLSALLSNFDFVYRIICATRSFLP